jgi:protein-ribulosamine 3-kinase
MIQCATGDVGKNMMESEYISLKEIERVMPSFVPKPWAWGEYKNAPEYTAFIIMDFLDIVTGAPDPTVFCALLAELHAKSQSPTGKFGFEVCTYQGPIGQNTTWHENWTFYFTRLLGELFDREIVRNGPDHDYEEEFRVLKQDTIPQILDPLQADGRVLKPCLIHGNIWEDNTATELHFNQPVIFDAGSHYVHNEFEIGMWRRDVVRFGKAHIRQYLRFMPPDEPREQWDDRNRLYSIKYDVVHALGAPATSLGQRQL